MATFTRSFATAWLVLAPAWSSIPTQVPAGALTNPQSAPLGREAQAAAEGAPTLVDVETYKGPFAVSGLTVTAVLSWKRLAGRTDEEATALASLEIRDTGGAVHYQETVPYVVEPGGFRESCSMDVQPLIGSNGSGLLLTSSCFPTAPLTGGSWQVLGVSNGHLIRVGGPLSTKGDLGSFVPGAFTRVGDATHILPDMLTVRVWTGYFFVSVPIRIDWHAGALAPGRRCLGQTGRGFVEEGCEFPAEDVRRVPQERNLTFVRLFREPNESSGPPAHIVVGRDSAVSILAGKVLIDWIEDTAGITVSPADDIWVRVRIDEEEGWIHTEEDLNAIGLFQSG